MLHEHMTCVSLQWKEGQVVFFPFAPRWNFTSLHPMAQWDDVHDCKEGAVLRRHLAPVLDLDLGTMNVSWVTCHSCFLPMANLRQKNIIKHILTAGISCACNWRWFSTVSLLYWFLFREFRSLLRWSVLHINTIYKNWRWRWLSWAMHFMYLLA